MLLLRAPDSLHQNDATDVDLDDYEALWDLAEELGEVRRRGITEGEIDSLPTRKFKSPGSDDEASDASAAEPRALQCQICLVDFENGDCLRCIPCKHDFHKDCLDEWLKRHSRSSGQPLSLLRHSQSSGQSLALLRPSRSSGQPLALLRHSRSSGQPLSLLRHSRSSGQPLALLRETLPEFRPTPGPAETLPEFRPTPGPAERDTPGVQANPWPC
ncbi:hypothetical protein ACOMHN_056477 [Nucella lapillus]